jgi:lauroyl/myristoyl acyltransferase
MEADDLHPQWRRGMALPVARLVQARDLGSLLYLAAALPATALLPEQQLAALVRAWTPLHLNARARWARTESRRVARLRGVAPDDAQARAFFEEYLGNIRLAKLLVLLARRPHGWQLRLEGEERLQQALAAGRGAILWVAPFLFAPLGAKMTFHQAGYTVSHLSRYSHGYSPSLLGARLLNPIRTGVEDRYLAERVRIGPDHQPQAALRLLSQRLRQNRVVSITASAGGSRVIEVPFLGGQMRLASGAPALAAQSGAALLPVMTLREPDGGFVSIIHEPLPTGGGARSEAQLAAAQGFATLTAETVQAHPAQFWWHADALRRSAHAFTGGP